LDRCDGLPAETSDDDHAAASRSRTVTASRNGRPRSRPAGWLAGRIVGPPAGVPPRRAVGQLDLASWSNWPTTERGPGAGRGVPAGVDLDHIPMAAEPRGRSRSRSRSSRSQRSVASHRAGTSTAPSRAGCSSPPTPRARRVRLAEVPRPTWSMRVGSPGATRPLTGGRRRPFGRCGVRSLGQRSGAQLGDTRPLTWAEVGRSIGRCASAHRASPRRRVGRLRNGRRPVARLGDRAGQAVRLNRSLRGSGAVPSAGWWPGRGSGSPHSSFEGIRGGPVAGVIAGRGAELVSPFH